MKYFIQNQWNKKGLLSNILYPFSYIVITTNFIKKKIYDYGIIKKYRPNIPTIIVGNIYIGGTGKTPLVISIVNKLKSLGWKPGVISRGYGVKIGKDAIVEHNKVSAKIFGDEPALINRETGVPISVHPNRIKAAKALMLYDNTLNVLICDDGLQHIALERDFEIIVQDDRKYGNGRVIPSGPLRETLNRLNTVHAIINNVPHYIYNKSININNKKPFELNMFLKPSNAYNLTNPQIVKPLKYFANNNKFKKIVAIAGIGNHERFMETLNQHNIYPSSYIKLNDHSKIEKSNFSQIFADIILMTSKDAIKYAGIEDSRLWEIKVEAQISNDVFYYYLSDFISKFHNNI
ncbi:tetraacyldisaccharide 4'-kinase [Candidatus Kinetoplastibacterium desouzaii TCC079E]|uniref:Tetraacyldisaccharide 4'-kinase n=1 Tax=Candidatus Kinetoplastidibacterium desouzai TCC079E TaxID=1208919 RepID=M1L265_9PROT|nr:tetraacyldisaccharide 4'-kinase [Candidatus Kinetoplastibacterium desouzaii]AGF46843.1 tetraacyldisaccharide 4'-kinase [Candidatus Kinetoplastibacterium desouzaii TCC079E]